MKTEPTVATWYFSNGTFKQVALSIDFMGPYANSVVRDDYSCRTRAPFQNADEALTYVRDEAAKLAERGWKLSRRAGLAAKHDIGVRINARKARTLM